MAGGGLPDIFGALGGGLSALAGQQPSSGGGGGGGGGSTGITPANAPNSIFTDPLVGAASALTAGDPTGQGQQQPPQQPLQAPTFTPPPPQQPQPVPYLSPEAREAAIAGTPTSGNWNPNTPATPAAPSTAQAIAAQVPGAIPGGSPQTSSGLTPEAEIAAGYRPPEATDADLQQAAEEQGRKQGATPGASTIGASSVNTDQQPQQQQQQNPLQTAGNFLQRMADRTPGPNPPGSQGGGRPGGGFNLIKALSDLITQGPGAFMQDLQGVAGQVGSNYGQEYTSQGGARGYGYGADQPPTQTAASGPPPQQPSAPQPPVSNDPRDVEAREAVQRELAAQEAQRNPATAAAGTAPIQAPGAQAAAQPTSAPGVGANPASDRWVSPQHVSAHRLAGTDTPPTPGYSTTMRDVRAPVFQNLTPQDKILIAGMMQAENAKDPIGPMESLANRAAAHHMTMGQLVRSRFYGPGASFARRGMAIQRSGQMPHYEAVMAAVQNGSNVLGGATDQGSGKDPNVGWSGGRILRSGETYNDWGGGRGHAASARWRKEIQARVRAENQQQPPTAQAVAPQSLFGEHNFGPNPDLTGIVNTTARLTPGGIPWQDWTRSSNVEQGNDPFLTPLRYPTAETGAPENVVNDWRAGLQSPQRASEMAAQLGSNDIDPLLDQLAQQWAQQTMGGPVPMPRPRPR
jgi:hypothetical protein